MAEKMIITIGRSYGSGGREIGEKLAKALNIPFYNREILQMAAKQSGMSEEVFEKVDETAASSLLYSVVSGTYMFGNHSAPMIDLPINDKLFILQSDIIKKIANEGSAVIVGRCADYILRDDPSCFNVFIHADIKKRVERAVNIYGLENRKVEEYINKMDKKRSTFYRYYSGEKWGDSNNYHLCIDSGAVGIDGAVELIQHLIRLKQQ